MIFSYRHTRLIQLAITGVILFGLTISCTISWHHLFVAPSSASADVSEIKLSKDKAVMGCCSSLKSQVMISAPVINFISSLRQLLSQGHIGIFIAWGIAWLLGVLLAVYAQLVLQRCRRLRRQVNYLVDIFAQGILNPRQYEKFAISL